MQEQPSLWQRIVGVWVLTAAVALFGSTWFPGTAGAETLATERHGVITQYRLPEPRRLPFGIAVDAEGRVWVTMNNTVGVLEPDTARWQELHPPEGKTLYLARTARDGSIWFTDFYLQPNIGMDHHLVQLDPQSGQFKRIPLPSPGAGPSGFAFADDGSIWVAEFLSGHLARVKPDGKVDEFPLMGPGERTPGPFGVELDGSGRVWVAETYQDRLAWLNPKTGEVVPFPLPEGFDGPTVLIRDGRGRLWASAHGANRVVSLDPVSGRVQEFHTLSPDVEDGPLSLPFGMAVGEDGHIWFAEHGGNRIGRLIPDAHTVVEYPLPQRNTWAQQIALDLGGNVWYAGYNAGVVGRIDRAAPYVTISTPERELRLRGDETHRGSLTVKAVGGPVALALAAVNGAEGSAEDLRRAGLTATFSPARVELAPGAEKQVAYTLAVASGAAKGERRVLLAGRSPGLLASSALRVTVLPPVPLSGAWFRAHPVLGTGLAVAAAGILVLAGYRRWRRRRRSGKG